MIFKKGHFVRHGSPNIDLVDQVAILFENQKNGIKQEVWHAHLTNHPVLCPVKAAIKIVKRLRQTGATDRTPIHQYINSKQQVQTSSASQCLTMLRQFVEDLPEKEVLGMTSQNIGNRSLRTTSAMAMALNGASDSEIQLYGRWRSLAFMDYLRPNVTAFAAPMSRRMIQQTSIAFTGRPTPQSQQAINTQSDLPSLPILTNEPPQFDTTPATLQSQINLACTDTKGLRMRW
jgi:hypothetical protein